MPDIHYCQYVGYKQQRNDSRTAVPQPVPRYRLKFSIGSLLFVLAADRTRHSGTHHLEYRGGNCNLNLTRNDLVTTIRLSTKRHVVLETDAFNSFLQIETRRAIRSNKSLVLLLLDVGRTQDLGPVVNILSPCVRTTDYIGWYEVGKRLGIVFTEVQNENREAIAELLKAKIANALCDHIEHHLSEPITATVLPSRRNYRFATTGTT